MLEKHYFPAANTPIGFYSCFENIISSKRAKKVVYIKGGSGTGKSTFMKKIGKKMLERGYHTELFHCSSDPDSLDGVHIVEKGVAVFDATAPHTMDPKVPGARDSILNLGEYWDEDKLLPYLYEIEEYSKRKSALYQKAYKYLAATKLFLKKSDKEITISTQKAANEYIDALKLKLYGEKRGDIRKLFASAITPKGHVDYLESILTGHVVGLIGGGQASLFLHKIMEAVSLAGYDADVFFCPFFPEEKAEHLVIPSLGVSFTTLNDYHYFDNCDDILFLDPGDETEEEGLIRSLLESAVDALAEAKEWHMKIEKIYVPAMNFSKLSPIYDEFIEKLL